MKIKLVLDINKTQQAQLNAVVTGRQGDKETVTVNVFIVDSGVPYNLTGQDIYYEGLKPNNAYVRDKTGVKMINATQGNFEYTFRPETFGVAGVGRRSYFSIEQGGTIRASTQDFGLVTLADAMTGHTMSGPYISELEQLIQEAQWLVNDINSRWTSINTQLTQLQNKLNTMDVVKRSGDTMTGNLNFDTTTEKRITSVDNTNKLLHGMVFRGNLMQYYDFLKSKSIFSYDLTNELFYVTASTNLLKKTGDTMTGHMIFRHNINQETADGLKGVNMVVNSSVNKWSVAPKMDGNPVWANEFAMDLNTGKVTVPSLATKQDGKATLTLTADATAGSASPQLATRRGNTVTVNLDLIRNTGSTNTIVTNLPASMVPTDSYTFDAIAVDGTPSRVLIRWNGEVHLDVIGKRYRILTTFVVN
ncbi:TPA: BppU family phage baseplate upper protein [Bacillus paranthracis]|uniref:BppU family phage baseplate upper protein n=1 Tax=Bacillus cereus group TaxID=86661 RepID=UPI0013D639A7|nr:MULTISPECIES: BppU family phage baseplate upper protein [Bacillus cereus group]HDR7766330.1 BppU family phage baseplate upper protein [Bacillus paranthracis]